METIWIFILKPKAEALVISAREMDQKEKRRYGRKRVSEISKADSYEKIAEFWDTHSLADYDDETDEVEITFEPAARRTWIGIDPELMAQLSDIARERRITTQTLVNLWLSQRVAELSNRP